MYKIRCNAALIQRKQRRSLPFFRFKSKREKCSSVAPLITKIYFKFFYDICDSFLHPAPAIVVTKVQFINFKGSDGGFTGCRDPCIHCFWCGKY